MAVEDPYDGEVGILPQIVAQHPSENCAVPSPQAGPFLEKNGLVVFEAESSMSPGNWSLTTQPRDGYTGSGYYATRNGAGIKWTFKIQEAGEYTMVWRNSKGSHDDKNNDSRIAISPARGPYCPPRPQKIFVGRIVPGPHWVWFSACEACGPEHFRPLRCTFEAGEEVTMTVTHRSTGHAIDRIVWFRSEYNEPAPRRGYQILTEEGNWLSSPYEQMFANLCESEQE